MTYGILKEILEKYAVENPEYHTERQRTKMEYPEHIIVVSENDIDEGNIVSTQD